ncbi:cupin domain-containing protein [Methylovirgula sp. 4M-Z18]|nr:cupin domain-containing protein [Methylovirgula sp. 4M-Z18]
MPKAVVAVPAERRWFLGLPTWIRASGAETNGTLSLLEQVIPPGFVSPWHVHHNEDESFYVIDGTMTVVVGDSAVTLNAGDFGFGPRGIPHGFRIEGTKPARILLMTNSGGLAAFIRETSVPAEGAAPPELNPADLPKVAAAAERHGMTILGPMPGI